MRVLADVTSLNQSFEPDYIKDREEGRNVRAGDKKEEKVGDR